MLPQANARLLSIAPPGTVVEDWDQPMGSPGAPKWQGNEDAYVIDKVRTSYAQDAGALTKRRDIQIVISGSLRDYYGQPLTINTGDIITYNWRGVVHARAVMDFDAPYMPSLPIQNFVKLHLNPEAVETALENQ